MGSALSALVPDRPPPLTCTCRRSPSKCSSICRASPSAAAGADAGSTPVRPAGEGLGWRSCMERRAVVSCWAGWSRQQQCPTAGLPPLACLWRVGVEGVRQPRAPVAHRLPAALAAGATVGAVGRRSAVAAHRQAELAAHRQVVCACGGRAARPAQDGGEAGGAVVAGAAHQLPALLAQHALEGGRQRGGGDGKGRGGDAGRRRSSRLAAAICGAVDAGAHGLDQDRRAQRPGDGTICGGRQAAGRQQASAVGFERQRLASCVRVCGWLAARAVDERSTSGGA